MKLFNETELSQILCITKNAVSDLVNAGIMPYKRIDGEIKFCPADINKWALGKPVLKVDKEKYIERFKKNLEINCPETLKDIKKYGEKFAEPWEPKRFYLDSVPNKKLGLVWYVRYLENGRVVPSHWTTRTNDRAAAERFAIENRDKLLKQYYENQSGKKHYKELYSILKKYYSKNSPYLEIDIKRGRDISEKSRVTYNNFINRQFIPHLKKNGIKDIKQIDTPFLSRFQNYLLADKTIKGKKVPGIKPQTINHYLSYVSLIFDHLIQEGYVSINPCKSLIVLKIREEDQKETGCYEVGKLKGVFNKKWKNELSYLLSMLIYTTNMRNSEIERIQLKDIILIDRYYFINIPESKSKNGIRIVPLHDFVYRKIMAYVKKNKIGNDDYIFKMPDSKVLGSRKYKAAYTELAGYAGYTAEQIKQENITFYSGRHFWKTLMNKEDLGDVEEYFMGHKVSENVAERYNHRDKQGIEKLLEKTEKVFQVLDKYIFN